MLTRSDRSQHDCRIDVRSDTATQASPEMMEALVGIRFRDDLLFEDEWTNKLVNRAASLFGMESGILCASGTMSNQVAVSAFCQPGDEVITGSQSHILNFEGAGLAAISGVQARAVPVVQGVYDVDELARSIQDANIQRPATGLICLESSYDLNGGFTSPLANLKGVGDVAKRAGLPVYLDGARIFNAAEALELDLREIGETVDGLQFCLNKGLGAPLGSVLIGNKEFISIARRVRQRLGGGMRHTGLIAVPGLVALDGPWRNVVRGDRERAQWLAEVFRGIEGIVVRNRPIATNIVVLQLVGATVSVTEFLDVLARHGVLVKRIGTDSVRLVLHRDISDKDAMHIASAVRLALS